MQSSNPYPLPHAGIPGKAPNSRDFATHGTQTSPHMGTNQQLPPPAAGSAPINPGQRPRRSRDSIYASAARRRKMQQQYTNIHNPPGPEEFWICEFCEYEAIFGEPPRALIRQYEIKDRKERRRLAEKRRLLEKAKMKGRKGKKATKNATKQSANQPHAQHKDTPDHPSLDSSHADEFVGEYEDDGPPTLTSTSSLPQTTMPIQGTVDAQKAGHLPPTDASVPIKGGINDGGTRPV